MKLASIILFISHALLGQVTDKSHENRQGNDFQISKLHPKLFVRSNDAKLGNGLALSDLRAKLHDSEYENWTSYDDEIAHWESLPAVAMQYLLREDKEKAIAVGEYIAQTPLPIKNHISLALAVYSSAIAFDWIRDALTDTLANEISDKLLSGAGYLKEAVVDDPAVNHNYTYVSLFGMTTAALAVYGEGPKYDEKCLEYLGMVNHLLLGKDMVLDTFQEKEGTWGEGNHYTPFVVFHPFLMTLKALSTATDIDYFELIRNHYDNFIEPISLFVIGNIRPDFTFERVGDVTVRVVPRKSFLRPTLELMASEINDKKLKAQVHSFSRAMADAYGGTLTHKIYGWMMMVTYNSKIVEQPSYKELPLTLRMGPDTYDQIMFRNSWGKDATMITFIGGDHYTDHQHFDKGSFLIYKKGALAIDAGGYSKMYGDSWTNYSTRSLAHNNILIPDPTEDRTRNGIGAVIYSDGGQRVIRKAQTHNSWRQYIEKSEEFGLNTADVLRYDTDEGMQRYNYLKTDLTKAYGDNVQWLDRQLVYLPEVDYLVVKDRVIGTKVLDKFWLLHFQERPTIDGRTPATGITDYKGGNIVEVNRTGKLDLGKETIEYSGRLFVKTLLPQKRTISIVGGAGYEFYNRFAKKNFPPEKDIPDSRESGHWRMEVSPENSAASTSFLNVIEITDSRKNGMVPTNYILSQDGRMEGAFFKSKTSYIVGFSTSLDQRGDTYQKMELPISYEIGETKIVQHLITELEANKEVHIFINGKRQETLRTSKAGVLYFMDKGGASRTVTIESVE